MAMTIAVTRNVPGRFRGFLASCMLELAPGIYAQPRMRKAVRERVWAVMMQWSEALPEDGGVCLFWKSRSAPSGLGVRMIGFPKKELVDHEGVWLTVSDLTAEYDLEELQALAESDDDPRAESHLAGDEDSTPSGQGNDQGT